MSQKSDRYYETYFLSSINPITFFQSMKQLAGHFLISFRHLTGLPNAENYQCKVKYNLPFLGEWFVGGGGSTKENSHSWNILTQRYAYDFIIVDEQGKSYKTNGQTLEDYHCYGKQVLSPAKGKVVEIRDGIKDYKGVGDGSIDWKTKDFRGNYVIIEHINDEFSFLSHFKNKSIKVRKGEEIKLGQVLGLCGNSGHSTEPHIHYHLQNKKNFWIGAGLPIRFEKIKIKKNRDTILKEHSFIEKKEFVENVE